MTDRLARANALRVAIWEWFKANPHSSINELESSMPHVPGSTLRKCCQTMRKRGELCMVGRRGLIGRFTVMLPPESEADLRRRFITRNAFKKDDERTRKLATMGQRARVGGRTDSVVPAPAKPAQDERIASGFDPDRPGVYVHHCGGLGYRSSGGQGALRHSVNIQAGDFAL